VLAAAGHEGTHVCLNLLHHRGSARPRDPRQRGLAKRRSTARKTKVKRVKRRSDVRSAVHLETLTTSQSGSIDLGRLLDLPRLSGTIQVPSQLVYIDNERTSLKLKEEKRTQPSSRRS